MLAALLGGCMKIYPDPELPDIVGNWDDFSCHEGTRDIRFRVLTFDGAETIAETTVACSALTVRFEDVPREHMYVIGELLDLDGELFSVSEAEVDLRDGISERIPVYFNGFSNFRIGWSWESGSCESNKVDAIELEVAYMGSPDFTAYSGATCKFPPLFATLSEGTHRVRLRARDYSSSLWRTVAMSPAVDVTIVADEVNDLGSVVLSPCDDDCTD